MDMKDNTFYFIAIGGVGMSALAKYLVERGASVSGSDLKESKYTKLLKEAGVQINTTHEADNIKEGMTVVVSTAVKETNPELIRAKELGLKIYHRSDALKMISDEFSENPDGIFFGFSGTHGKTTTSGLCSYILKKGGLKPSYVVGGIIPEIGENGEFDGDKYFCAELDESDGTIAKYSTDIAIINNMEEDHLDHYINGFSDIAKTFDTYLNNKPNQKVIINSDNEGNRKFMEIYPNRNYITFGKKNADYEIKNIEYEGLGSRFEIFYKNKKLVELKLSVLGEHNVYNATAVYVALCEAGIDTTKLKDYFYSFSGMGRRFQKVCEFDGIEIFDDYAHHPSEIKTTLNGLKSAVKDTKRVVAIFQPHRYTRLKSLWNEFKTAFDSADKLFIIDVYPAGEDEINGVTSKNFAKEISHKNSEYISGNIEECSKKIFEQLKKNDMAITLGAGSVTQIGGIIKNIRDERK